jgi:hypothetical protein
MWTLAFGRHEDRTPTHGYAATREAAMRRSLKAGGGNRPALPLAKEKPRSEATRLRGLFRTSRLPKGAQITGDNPAPC